jgi:hypothetical protein
MKTVSLALLAVTFILITSASVSASSSEFSLMFKGGRQAVHKPGITPEGEPTPEPTVEAKKIEGIVRSVPEVIDVQVDLMRNRLIISCQGECSYKTVKDVQQKLNEAGIYMRGIGRVSASVKAESESDERIVLSSMISLVDEHIKKALDSLNLMAVTEEARSGDRERIRHLLKKIEETNVPAVVFFGRPDGSYFTANEGHVLQNLKDLEYFSKVIHGEEVIGSPVTSTSAGKKTMVVAVPIRKAGKVVALLGAYLYLEELSKIISSEMSLPEGIIFCAIDANARILLNRQPEFILEDSTRVGSFSLISAVKEMLSRKEGTMEYKSHGKLRRVIFKSSPLTGWRFALETPSKR